jgi:steroid delta-isomerase-like uncharacterized protein
LSEENKAVIRRYVEEVQNQHRLEVIQEIFEPNIVNHDVAGGLPSPQGADGISQFFGMMFVAFPDFHAVIEDQLADGDRVVTRKMVSGTHLGDLMGIPATGKRMEIPVIDIFRVVGGRCTDHWSVIDQLSMMQQLGLLPSPQEPGSSA